MTEFNGGSAFEGYIEKTKPVVDNADDRSIAVYIKRAGNRWWNNSIPSSAVRSFLSYLRSLF